MIILPIIMILVAIAAIIMLTGMVRDAIENGDPWFALAMALLGLAFLLSFGALAHMAYYK